MLIIKQFKLLDMCITISASRCGYHAVDGRWYCSTRIVTLNCANMAGLMFDATELESFWGPTSKVTRNCVQTPCLFECLCNNMFVEMWIFLFKCFEKHIWEPFEHLEQFACDSEWMCAKVWARVVV